ncbi:MAG TPA: GNVR domain-containing protein [Candidatus Omnitrophota bacterium]|nr:hypothetical protein [Candidatus Omnitrophota bacterium]HQO59079.1 GNVR domain-containing protein [Candidatus Omnitrophota bacterium]
MAELNTDTMSFMAYLKMFFRRKELVIIPMLLGLSLGVCAGILLPKKFLSSTVILVEEGKTDNPLFSDLAVSSTVQQRMNTIKESMLGWTSLVELVKRLHLDKNVKTRQQFEALILGIRKDIIIRLRANNILELAYVGLDPVQTQAVVQNITDIFIERNKKIQTQETQDAITFIEQQLKIYKGKIKSAEIAELQDQLDELLIDSTERHPLVRQLQEKMDIQKAELEAENLQYTKPDKLEKETSNPLISSIKAALDKMEGTAGAPTKNGTAENDELYKIMLLNTVAARDVRVNEQIYNMLLQRMETAKITQSLQLSKEGTKYTILDPPRVPLQPFQPNRVLVAVIGAILGAALGIGLVFLLEFLDKSFIDVEEAKDFLGAPLLGAISKIETEVTVRMEREKQMWMYAVTVLGSVILVIVTIAVENFLK